jgi:peroxiredoxin
MTVTSPGETTPVFRHPASSGQTLSTSSFLGKVPVAMVFVPDLDESGALIADLNRRHAEFGRQRSQILFITKATSRAVRQFADDHQVTIPILADAGGTTTRAFGLEQSDGRPRLSAVVSDVDGRLVQLFDPLDTDGAADRLLGLTRRP